MGHLGKVERRRQVGEELGSCEPLEGESQLSNGRYRFSNLRGMGNWGLTGKFGEEEGGAMWPLTAGTETGGREEAETLGPAELACPDETRLFS